jgi:tetratricopeptide (TPR) repeat protein
LQLPEVSLPLLTRTARLALLALAALIAATLPARAQQADTRELESYLHAVTRADAPSRTSALRDFLTSWPRSSLRQDALLWLAWDTHISDRAVAAGYARDVLRTDPANVIANALLFDAAPPKSSDQLYDEAQMAIADLPSMRAPAGMGAGEFYVVQTQVTAILCAAVGNVAFERKDYDTARSYLRRAATLSPNDARYAYSLGLADLSGKDQNSPEGYLELARAVDLARGSAAAQQIDAFARRRYQDEGGRPGDWDRFLAAAATPNAAPSHPAPPAIAAAAPAAQPRRPVANASVGARLPRPSDLPPAKVTDIAVGDPGLPGPDAAHRQPFRPGAPLSLGILIEASLADKHNRKTMANALGDLVRHLTANEKSEAFVLSFAKDVIFNEDLTGDYRALENAMDRIKPQEGAALIDAVTIAAFQLNRVSHEGNNRVLLVISDGRNLDSKMSPLNAGSQLASGAVRVYCIGVGALSTDGGRRLQTLASSTGGDATFVNDTSQFRGTAQQMAAKFGVEFPE